MSGEENDGATEPAEQNKLDAIEQKIREEIRSLQEKRADVLMKEVHDLKRQKEKALLKASKLEKALEELRDENTALRLEAGTREATQLQLMEQTLMNAQREKDVLAKKLADASKQNDNLRLRLKKTDGELQQMKCFRGSRDRIEVPFLPDSPRNLVGALGSHSPRMVLGQDADTGMHTPTGVDEDEVTHIPFSEQLVSSKDNSAPGPGWMEEEGEGATPEQGQPDSGGEAVKHAKGSIVKRRHSSSSGQEAKRVHNVFNPKTPPPSHIRLRQLGSQHSHSPLLGTHCHSAGDLSFGGGASPCVTPDTSAQSSPSMRTKRYVLSTVTKRDAETQTLVDIWSLEEQGSLSSTELQSTLLQVRETVTALNAENEALAKTLASKEDELQDGHERYRGLVGTLESYHCECEELRQSMDGAVRWVKEKIAEFQEELDIARIIYTLHGSLSQESTVIEKMCQKLKDSQTHVGELLHENSALDAELSRVKAKLAEVKHKYKQVSPKKVVHQKPSTSPHTLPLAHQLIRSLRDTPSSPPQSRIQGITVKGPPSAV